MNETIASESLAEAPGNAPPTAELMSDYDIEQGR